MKSSEVLAAKVFMVSVIVVDQFLAKHDFRRRQAFKNEAGKQVEERDEQFEIIEKLVETACEKGNPVMSIDVKKRVDRQFLSQWQALHSGARPCQ